MQRAVNWLLYSVLWSFTWLPFTVIYLISDVLFLINFYIIGYRKKVVIQNLKNAFPEKNEKEIRTIAKKFYRHLIDFLFESIKTIHISKRQINKRVVYRNHELFHKYFEEKRDVTLVSGHYANWEWFNNIPSMVDHKIMVLYQPLQNSFSDNLINNLRSKFGLETVPMHEAYKKVVEYKNNNVPTITWFLGDQRPPSATSVWTTFLNQETGFYIGAEKIARKLDHAVVFMDMQKLKRGYYQAEFIELFSASKQTSEFEITKAHVKTLEDIIKRKPEHWLWSHKRWKHKRPDNKELI